VSRVKREQDRGTDWHRKRVKEMEGDQKGGGREQRFNFRKLKIEGRQSHLMH